MATTDELVRFVIHEIDTHMPRLTSGPGYLPRQMAAAALARGRKLWAALDAVQAAGQAVVGGLLSRAIWECWVVGLFVLFKGDDGYEHLAGAYDRANDLITDRWPDDETRPELRRLNYPKQKLNYETMATEVTRLLAERGSPVATLSYDGLYRSWSTLAAHAAYGSLMLFVEATDSYLKLGPGRLPLPAEVDLRVTSTFLGHLAWFVLREFSIDGTKLINAVEQLHLPPARRRPRHLTGTRCSPPVHWREHGRCTSVHWRARVGDLLEVRPPRECHRTRGRLTGREHPLPPAWWPTSG
jgi:hypothetical protein